MAEDWRAITLRIVPETPIDLDGITAKYDPRTGTDGKDFFPTVSIAPNVFRGALKADSATLGLETADSLTENLAKVMKFCALASEHDVNLIALAEGDYSGFENFGIRTEFVAGLTEEDREMCREQILAFWDIDVIF